MMKDRTDKRNTFTTPVNTGRKGQWLHMHRKLSSIFCILAVSLLILMGSSIRTFASSRSDDSSSLQKYYTSIRIEKGDSLWSIADSYVTDHVMSKDDFIREVCQVNHINKDDILRSGDYLVVFYYSE